MAGRKDPLHGQPAAAQAALSRAHAVDALRGLAILGMVLVAAQPEHVLPSWMYHAQEPPPTHEINQAIAGLTWPDLVLPFFLFTMGAAIPLALARRIERGASSPGILGGALMRGALLVFFALFRAHFDASVSGLEPEPYKWMVALAGFVVLFGIFVRLPQGWSRSLRGAVRGAAWAGALLMFAIVRFPDGSAFRPERIDLILLILAYCAIGGTLIWLATRARLMGRLAVLALFAAVRLAGGHDGWASALYAYDPIPWLYSFAHLEYLFAVIPGTIAGDLLVAWMSPRAAGPIVSTFGRGWTNARAAALGSLLLLFIPLLLLGITTREVFGTTVAAALLCLAVLWLTRRPLSPAESLVAQLVPWGVFWLLLGLVLDPFDGGTKKIPPTLAWFFQCCGLAIFLMAAFTILVDSLRKPRWLGLLVDNGQNPMVGYVGLGMVVLPLYGLSTVKDRWEATEPSPWVAFGASLLLVLLVALMVRALTRRKLFWRS